MADDQKKPDESVADQDDVRARAVAEAEARDEHTPYPTQADLDRVKLGDQQGKGGAYKTRQTKAG